MLLAAVTVLAVALLARTPLPAVALLGALAAATVLSVMGRAPTSLPPASVLTAQALLGAMIGLELRPESLVVLARAWPAILLAVVATTALSIVAGLLLARLGRLPQTTGVMSMAAGGASAITSLSHGVGSDRRLVVLSQYTRVLIVGFATPVLAAAFWPGTTRPAASGALGWTDGIPAPDELLPLAVVLGVAVAGVLVSGRLRVPAGGLLLPMVGTAGLAMAGLTDVRELPGPLMVLTYVVVGWYAGLGFRRQDLRAMVRPWAYGLALTLVIIAACFGLGVLLALMTDATVLEGYLATTPGGIWIVVAIASDTGADLGLIATAQVLRVILMVVAIPLLASWLRSDGP